MIKVAVTGGSGRMGQEIIAALQGNQHCKLVLALVRQGHHFVGKQVKDALQLDELPADPIFTDSILHSTAFDVLIDFSSPLATSYYVSECVALSRPMVIGTTGLNAKQQGSLQQAAKKIPLLFAPNMSIGVNICYQLLANCAKLMGNDWQAAIADIHHQHKKDAPSGTALKMAEIIAANSKPQQPAVQINSVRIGEVTGEHSILFVGDGESIQITHRSFNRQAYANGAVHAAIWLAQQPPGLYSMQDLMTDLAPA